MSAVRQISLGEARIQIALILNKILLYKKRSGLLRDMGVNFGQAIANELSISKEKVSCVPKNYFLGTTSLKIYNQIIEEFRND